MKILLGLFFIIGGRGGNWKIWSSHGIDHVNEGIAHVAFILEVDWEIDKIIKAFVSFVDKI